MAGFVGTVRRSVERFLLRCTLVATYRDILDQLNIAVAVAQVAADRLFRITYLNQSGQSLFGRSSSRAVGMPVDELLRDDHASSAALQQVLESGAPFTKREAPMVVAEGVVRVNYSISLLSETELLIEFERLDRFMRIDRDERQVSLQETTRKLARGVAHEVKNPLGGIRGAAQLLHRQLATAEQREYTSVIIAEADRLRNLVDRIIGPNGTTDLAPVNMHEVIERVVKLLDAEHTSRIAFKRFYDPSLPKVQADFERLVQATLNVLLNAALALRETPQPVVELHTRVLRQFTIGATRHRLVANVGFIDNGPGVPADIADRIFYPMISGRPDGSGLGLAITQTIIAQHQGIVECESEPGRTLFSFYLPIRQVRPPERRQPGPGQAAEPAAEVHVG